MSGRHNEIFWVVRKQSILTLHFRHFILDGPLLSLISATHFRPSSLTFSLWLNLILIVYFWPPNFCLQFYSVLTAQFQFCRSVLAVEFCRPILIAKFWLLNFDFQILVARFRPVSFDRPVLTTRTSSIGSFWDILRSNSLVVTFSNKLFDQLSTIFVAENDSNPAQKTWHKIGNFSKCNVLQAHPQV